MNLTKDNASPSAAPIRDGVVRNTPAFTRLLAVGLLTAAWCLGAAEPKTTAEPWVSLFNGRDLTGWKIVALTNPAPAVVEDGAMVLRQRTNTIEHTFVTSEREYDDFIL